LALITFGGDLNVHIGILGGGMQGCCCALALAERGVEVTLFDRNQQLLSRAAVANEGKIHLGYMYANDLSYSTARTMMTGALAFAPFLARHLEIPIDSLNVSQPAAYVVHCDSQRSAEEIAAYLATVHSMIVEAADGRSQAYFGRDLSRKPRPWSGSERELEFDCDIILAAFESPEVAINPVALAQALRERIHSDRRIKVHLANEVLSVEDIDQLVVITEDPSGTARHRFDHVINALWDGRLAIDETLGLRPGRPWLHRLKYGVSFYLPNHAERPPSATFISGPLGEVVSYQDGLIYLTWYPACLLGISSDIAPPKWPTYPDEPLHSRIARGTLDAMAKFVISLRRLVFEDLVDVTVKGGVIVAWGETDIYDPRSELHRRYEIGVTSNRQFHSVDPGKLTMAPYFAQVCADRIVG
jgi:glycine/D-amino acid oxidase-like deaminating enzyme